MMLFQLDWPRCSAGYEIEKRPPGKRILDGAGTYIVPRFGSKSVDYYDPFKITGLYRRLADTKTSAQGALDFTNKYGYLGDLLDSVILFKAAVRNMRALISAAERGQWKPLEDYFAENKVGQSSISLRSPSEPGGRPHHLLRPTTLMSALVHQLILDWSSYADDLRKCAWCPEYFRFGPGTGRRKTAIYCSPKCQNAHTYQRRREAQA